MFFFFDKHKREDNRFRKQLSDLWTVKKQMDDELETVDVELREQYLQIKKSLPSGSPSAKEAYADYQQEREMQRIRILDKYAEDLQSKEAFIQRYLDKYTINIQPLSDDVLDNMEFKDAVILEKKRQCLSCKHHDKCTFIASYRAIKPWCCTQCSHFEEEMQKVAVAE